MKPRKIPRCKFCREPAARSVSTPGHPICHRHHEEREQAELDAVAEAYRARMAGYAAEASV
jgi:hypothetical protein